MCNLGEQKRIAVVSERTLMKWFKEEANKVGSCVYCRCKRKKGWKEDTSGDIKPQTTDCGLISLSSRLKKHHLAHAVKVHLSGSPSAPSSVTWLLELPSTNAEWLLVEWVWGVPSSVPPPPWPLLAAFPLPYLCQAAEDRASEKINGSQTVVCLHCSSQGLLE